MSVTRFFICFQVPFQPQAMRHMQHNNKRSACIKEMLEILTVFISFVIQTKRDNTNQISCAAYTLSSPPHTYVCLLTRNAPQNIFLTYVYCATDITPRVLGHPNPILCLPSTLCELCGECSEGVSSYFPQSTCFTCQIYVVSSAVYSCSPTLFGGALPQSPPTHSLSLSVQGNKNKYFICLTWLCLLRFLVLPRFVALQHYK